jgi:hypothetical protein
MRIAILSAAAALAVGCFAATGASAAPVSGPAVKDTAASRTIAADYRDRDRDRDRDYRYHHRDRYHHRHCYWRHHHRSCDRD